MAPLEDSQQVFEHMNKHMVKSIFGGEEQVYLPKSIFDEVTTRDVIRLLISKDDDLYLNTKEEEELIDKAYRSGRKLFAACVFGDIPLTCLKTLLDKGFTDRDFPLIEEHCPGLKLKRKFVSSFLPNQKRFNATYFGLGSFQTLDENAVKPIEYQPLDSNNRLGGGSFGSVIQVRIHPDHRGFKLVSNKDKDVFAMKVVSREGRDQQFNQAMATLPHPHLLQCLASFTFSKEYFMIYERADSDLENFMCRNSDAGSLSDFEETDIVAQLCGLASAVSMIHNQGNDPNTLLVPHSDLTGYNHDIKPDNILMFVYDRDGKKTYWLRLADHSLAKVNEYNKKNRESHRTNGKLGTLTFQAPESDAGKGISRPYDIWSLGCVWLEVLVWYREGYSALDAFRDARISESNPGPISDDRFYNLNQDKQPELCPSVVKKIQELKANCQGPLKEIADIIPAMLEIDYNKRPNAHKLVKLLEHLYSGEDAPPEVVSVEDYPDVPIFGSPQPSVSDSESEFEGFVLTRPT